MYVREDVWTGAIIKFGMVYISDSEDVDFFSISETGLHFCRKA
jgi:hypothetical protein